MMLNNTNTVIISGDAQEDEQAGPVHHKPVPQVERREGWTGRVQGAWRRRIHAQTEVSYTELSFSWDRYLCLICPYGSHTFLDDFAAYEIKLKKFFSKTCLQDFFLFLSLYFQFRRIQGQLVLDIKLSLRLKTFFIFDYSLTIACTFESLLWSVGTCSTQYYCCFYLQGRIQRARLLLFSLLISPLHHLPPPL